MFSALLALYMGNQKGSGPWCGALMFSSESENNLETSSPLNRSAWSWFQYKKCQREHETYWPQIEPRRASCQFDPKTDFMDILNKKRELSHNNAVGNSVLLTMLLHMPQLTKSPLVQAMPCCFLCATPLSQPNLTYCQQDLGKRIIMSPTKWWPFLLASMHQVSSTRCCSSYAHYTHSREKVAL